MDKLKVYRGETPQFWLQIDKDDGDTATASEEERVNVATQDEGVVDDHPNELGEVLFDDQSAGPTAGQHDDQLPDENDDKGGRQPGQTARNTADDQATVGIEIMSPRLMRQR